MATVPQRRATLVVALTEPVTRNIGPGGAPVVVGYTSTGKALSIEGLRIQFQVTKSLKKNPNAAEISVFNLSPASRASIHKQGLKLSLQAGYDDDLAIIFSGQTREVDHAVEGPDWVTKIRSGDGTAQLNSPVSASLPKGAKLKDVVGALVGQMSVGAGNLGEHDDEMGEEYASGVSLHGSASRNLEWALARAGLTYSIQDGKLQVLKVDGFTSDTAYVLSSNTGLIGSPEHSVKPKKGKPRVLKVKALMLPMGNPGRRIQMDSREQKGLFVVSKVVHKGDTHEGDWTSELELVEVKG